MKVAHILMDPADEPKLDELYAQIKGEAARLAGKDAMTRGGDI